MGVARNRHRLSAPDPVVVRLMQRHPAVRIELRLTDGNAHLVSRIGELPPHNRQALFEETLAQNSA